MSISVKNVVGLVNELVNGYNQTPLELAQMTAMQCAGDKAYYAVDTCASLPLAANNTGRMIFVRSGCHYVYSDGLSWANNFNSEPSWITQNIWSWGTNTNGVLGNGNTTDTSSPASIIGEFTDWCQVSTNVNHTLGLRSNGTLWAWGGNISGELGDGTAGNTRSSPVSIVGEFTDWCQASAGFNHNLAVRKNGTLWAWGGNSDGQLGINTTIGRSSPVSVVGGFTDWCQASAGLCHSLAVRCNGTLWAWGNNYIGQLGDDTTTSTSSPVSVVGGFTDWWKASAGLTHSLGIRLDGTMWAWGGNSTGELGDGTTDTRSSPVSVVGGFTDWCQASAMNHTLGIRRNGTLWAWGSNGNGKLGNGAINDRSSPVSVIGGFTDWCQASAGSNHSLAVRTDGTMWAWGGNSTGQLGDGTTDTRSSPVSVIGGFTDWWQVSTQGCFVAAIRAVKRGL